MINERLLPQPDIAPSGNLPSGYFNTVLYTGNGSAQRIGGYINRGAVFNGSNSFISLPQSTDFDLNGNGSFSVWVQRNNTNRVWIIEKANGGSGGYSWQLYFYNGEYGFQTHDTSNNIITVSSGTSGIATNAWEHIVITSNTSRVYKMYVNGTLKDTQTLSGPVSVNTNGVTIGKYSLASGYELNGTLDQLRVFNKELSSSEITTLYEETFASTTISTTDIFGDSSGVALYQLDGNANDTGGVSGKFGEAAIFNGTSSKIRLPNDLVNNVSPQTFSVAFWFNTDNLTSYQQAFSAYDYASGTNYGWSIYTGYSSSKVRFVSYSSNGNMDFQGATILSTNTWYHCVLTYPGGSGTAKLYLNGSEDGSETIPGNRSYKSNHTYYIGASNNGGGGTEAHYNGRIDDVRVYTDVLTSTEVGYIYNNTTASIPTDNLEAYYKLNGDARDEQQLHDGTATNVTYAYNGNASNVTYQEATNFSPDLVWVKNRDTAQNNILSDSVTDDGTSNSLPILISNTNERQYTGIEANGLYIRSLDSNGFTVGSSIYTGASGTDYVAWCFNAGTDAPATNNDGDNTSTVKANTDAGFSIITYTGDGANNSSVGHGLNSAPEMFIYKRTSSAGSWNIVHKDVNNYQAYLEFTSATANNDSSMQSPTNSVIRFNTNSPSFNGSSQDWLIYAFHSVDGIQKVGSYTGSSNGVTIETGFEPAFILVKASQATYPEHWSILDAKRGSGKSLNPNLSNSESDSALNTFTIFSNGFSFPEQTTADAMLNEDGYEYIYLAIAADPDTTTPTVENSFDVVTWTGDGSSSRSISTDFKPDMIWLKNRTGTANNHFLLDSVRGKGSGTSYLNVYPNVTNAEANDSGIASIDDNGFTTGSSRYASNDWVAWCWKAGGLPQINTEGTIDSVVSVNDAAGFSIVTWTGDGNDSTVGHGLSQQPELVITKGRANLATYNNWTTYHKDLSTNHHLYLNTSDAEQNGVGDYFRDAAFSSTVIGLGNDIYGVNVNNTTMVAYCFTSISGYQKVGKYTGTGVSGLEVSLSFSPRFLLVKGVGATGWILIDSQRGSKELYANLSDAEDASATAFVLGTNKFTVNSTGTWHNSYDVDYIYLAIK